MELVVFISKMQYVSPKIMICLYMIIIVSVTISFTPTPDELYSVKLKIVNHQKSPTQNTKRKDVQHKREKKH